MWDIEPWGLGLDFLTQPGRPSRAHRVPEPGLSARQAQSRGCGAAGPRGLRGVEGEPPEQGRASGLISTGAGSTKGRPRKESPPRTLGPDVTRLRKGSYSPGFLGAGALPVLGNKEEGPGPGCWELGVHAGQRWARVTVLPGGRGGTGPSASQRPRCAPCAHFHGTL